MSLSKLQGIVKDREAWRAAVLGIVKSQKWLSNWTTTTGQCNDHNHLPAGLGLSISAQSCLDPGQEDTAISLIVSPTAFKPWRGPISSLDYTSVGMYLEEKTNKQKNTWDWMGRGPLTYFFFQPWGPKRLLTDFIKIKENSDLNNPERDTFPLLPVNLQ